MEIYNILSGFYKNSQIDKVFEDSGISILGSGIGETSENWGGDSVYVTHDVIYFLIDGTSGRIRLGEETTEMKPGCAYLLPHGVTVAISAPRGLKKIYFHLDFSMNDGTDLFDDFARIGEVECPEIIRRMSDGYMKSDPISLLRVKTDVIDTVLRIAEKYNYSKQMPKLSELTKNAIGYINGNLRADLSCEAIAEALCVSKMTLWRHFKGEMGMSPKAYLTRRLMAKAVNMLTTSDAKIHEISAELGFYDQFYFSRVFKAEMGFSPARMRAPNIIKTI